METASTGLRNRGPGPFPRTALAVLALGFCADAPATPAPPAPRDHVLLVTIDDLNDWIGCLSDPADPDNRTGQVTGRGHPQASTPHLDRLARRGILFTNAHCQAPMCRPSRISFLSGLRPTTTGIYGNRPRHDAEGPLKAGEDVPWITRRFARAGYRTFAAGKILHASRNQPLGGTLCFKTDQGPYPKEKISVPKHVTPAGVWDFGPYPGNEDDYTDLRIARWTLDHIRKPAAPDDPPRFLALGFYNPHVPLFAPQRWFDAAPSAAEVLLAPTRQDDLDDLPAIARRMHNRVAFQSTTRWVLAEEARLRELTRAYLASVSAMDDALGRVIDALDASDMADRTWIVVLSDHGWHLGEKDHIAKQTLWTRSTRIPLIIVPPKRMSHTPRGVRCDRPAELLDIYPTLIDACGLAPEPADTHLDGISLMPWIADPSAGRARPAITTLYAHNHSVVGDRFRYTRYADGSEELYDRETDPHEFDNLIARAASDGTLKRVIRRLAAHIPQQEPGQPDLVNDPPD